MEILPASGNVLGSRFAETPMCTVTWLQEDRGYRLFFSRDELRSRQPAEPPAERTTRGVRYLAPRDGNAGGTWIALNELGVTVCLLNRHPAVRSADEASKISRGHLVTEMADAASWATVADRLSALDPHRYRPFTLVVVQPNGEVRGAVWDGLGLAIDPEPPRMPICSSSFDETGAKEVRQKVFAEAAAAGALGAGELLAFHRSHAPEPGAYSPCMHRPDAKTLSFCVLQVDPRQVSITYADGPPCRTALGEPLSLPRRFAKTASAI